MELIKENLGHENIRKTDLAPHCAELIVGVETARTYPMNSYVDKLLYKHSEHSRVCTYVLNICPFSNRAPDPLIFSAGKYPSLPGI